LVRSRQPASLENESTATQHIPFPPLDDIIDRCLLGDDDTVPLHLENVPALAMLLIQNLPGNILFRAKKVAIISGVGDKHALSAQTQQVGMLPLSSYLGRNQVLCRLGATKVRLQGVGSRQV